MEELRLKLINDLNSCGLPIEAIMFVIKDVYRDVQDAFREFQIQKNAAANAPKQPEVVSENTETKKEEVE